MEPPAGLWRRPVQVHACRIKDGKVGYCNRWVQTSRFKQVSGNKHMPGARPLCLAAHASEARPENSTSEREC